ncbi:MAG: hypothetical protein WC743_03445 [Mucilaginibacter sp.]|jgi:hypothetical protein
MAYQSLYDHAYFMAASGIQKTGQNIAKKFNDQGTLWQYNNLS